MNNFNFDLDYMRLAIDSPGHRLPDNLSFTQFTQWITSMNEYENFIKELDVFAQADGSKFLAAVKTINVLTATIKISVDPEFLTSHGLNSDIQFVLSLQPRGAKIVYYYKNLEIDPICHYIQPDNCRKVNVLEICRAAIQQDTNKPDIKELELSAA